MKKGFTLIELLAVIVILAVLALIATPIVLNIIDDSKKNATLRSSENYIKAVEFSIAKSVMENKKLSDGEYPIMSNGNICLGTLSGSTCDNELVVEVSGETPESGTITIKSRKIDSYEFTYASGFVVVDGKISDGEVVEQLSPGLYDENDNLVYTWEELLDEGIITVEDNAITGSNSNNLTGKLVIDDSITNIEFEAFAYSELTSVVILESLNINDNAFYACTSLASVTFLDSVSLGTSSFQGCTSLTSIIIPEGANSLPDSVFADSGLVSVTIPKSVTIIDMAFSGCSNLTTINYTGSEEDWNSIEKIDWDYNTPSNKQIIYNYAGE